MLAVLSFEVRFLRMDEQLRVQHLTTVTVVNGASANRHALADKVSDRDFLESHPDCPLPFDTDKTKAGFELHQSGLTPGCNLPTPRASAILCALTA